MAIHHLTSSTGTLGTGSDRCDGVIELTNSSADVAYGLQKPVKNHTGDLAGMLLGQAIINLQVEGYASSFAPPDLLSAMSVGGLAGKAVSTSLRCSMEDMAKVSATGKGIPV